MTAPALDQLYREMAQAVEKGWAENITRRKEVDPSVFQTPAFKRARPGIEH